MNQVNCSVCGKVNWNNYLQPATNKYAELKEQLVLIEIQVYQPRRE